MRRHDHKKGLRTMPTVDRAFRPAGYWDPADPRTAVLQNIKGQNRRTIVARHLEGDAVQEAELHSTFLADELEQQDRAVLGAIHPSWMGGEYLPDYLPGEVEIARIVLASVTQDVVSIRARRRGRDRRIQYRVLDEYDSDFRFLPRSSRRPLTLEELIGLIETVQNDDAAAEGRSFIANVIHYNADSPLERLAAFVTVESLFYPGLGAHFRDVTRRIARDAV